MTRRAIGAYFLVRRLLLRAALFACAERARGDAAARDSRRSAREVAWLRFLEGALGLRFFCPTS